MTMAKPDREKDNLKKDRKALLDAACSLLWIIDYRAVKAFPDIKSDVKFLQAKVVVLEAWKNTLPNHNS